MRAPATDLTSVDWAARKRGPVIHPLLVRLTHWVNAAAMIVMIMSGLATRASVPVRPAVRAIVVPRGDDPRCFHRFVAHGWREGYDLGEDRRFRLTGCMLEDETADRANESTYRSTSIPGTRAEAAFVIEQIMLFSLGFLVAALGALAIAPAFWSRAIRLATRQLEMVLPLSPREIRAERDLLRAELAVEQRKLEQKVEALAAVRAHDMAELGRRAVAVAEKDRELEAIQAHLDARDAEIADLRRLVTEALDALEATRSSLDARDAEIAELRHFSAEATDTLDATTAALHDANARWEHSEAELEDARRELVALQKLCAETSEALAELERKLVHEHESQTFETAKAIRGDERLDLRLEHDAALARLKAATAEIAAVEAGIPATAEHDAERRGGQDKRGNMSIASDPSLRRQFDRLVVDLMSYQDAVDADAASHERGRASDRARPDEKAVLRKRISEVGATAVRLAETGTMGMPERNASEQPPPLAASEPEA